ncbi:hypothetical protein QBC33DRAFT_543123 [Phialemonium atrogriseum]|uniref:Secreted protein n=1 Tax=Phialemonium atrogriseum TaxID=1093897 RepID=A0AAJ0FKV0_9PEZI|nr:uncharacterized protein QBC33DRAFT_543123 [Phialemonium atrogriseum]KAK1765989.1 hypothetical protein QBC33DRAFT_543123 [Phialemonium atrogriseum]
MSTYAYWMVYVVLFPVLGKWWPSGACMDRPGATREAHTGCTLSNPVGGATVSLLSLSRRLAVSPPISLGLSHPSVYGAWVSHTKTNTAIAAHRSGNEY